MWPVTRRLLLSVLASANSRVATTAAAAPSRPFSMVAHAATAAAPAVSRSSSADSQVGEPTAVYEHRIDVGRIAQRLRVNWLTWLPARVRPLRRRLPPAAAASRGEALLFAHGFLGSRFDMADACERLASAGFVIVAPDFGESISGSFVPTAGTTRMAIAQQAMALAQTRAEEADGAVLRWGVWGHSAGAGTATTLPGKFELGRAALCGYRGYTGDDPLLVVASAGDGVIPLSYILSALDNDAAAGRPVQVQDLPLPVQDLPLPVWDLPSTAAAAAAPQAQPDAPLPSITASRSARIYPTRDGAPTHISFLFKQTNDAMVDFLSPFLPLAKVLRVPILDFDRYKAANDAEATARDVIPLLEAFFLTNSKGT